MRKLGTVVVTPEQIVLNGRKLDLEGKGAALLVEAYRKEIGDYPKFFKMDPLCKLGFVASELLLKEESPRKTDCEDRAVILFGRSGSLCDDREYESTIDGHDGYYPSPAVFVYTLPNIVTGEIAIRNKYYGETSFYVLDKRDDSQMEDIVSQAFQDPVTTQVLCGWVDCFDPEHFEAELSIIEKQ